MTASKTASASGAEPLACSFCGKTQADVHKLIASQSALICTECIALCIEIHADDGYFFPSGAAGAQTQHAAEPQAPALGRLNASWRGSYVVQATADERADVAAGRDAQATDRCPFCAMFAGPSLHEHVIHRGERAEVILNAYPYSSGHTMVLPTRHLSGLGELTDSESSELWELVRHTEKVLSASYQPDGINIGINLGRAAGAGLPGHLHVHLVPRWSGDTNFMTVTAETRVMPESLRSSAEKLRANWSR